MPSLTALRALSWLALLALACISPLPTASAQAQHGAPVLAIDAAGVRYVEAASLAVVLGDVVTAAGDVLTWRGAEGVATFFLGSSQALLQSPGSGGPDEWTLSAPVRRASGDELADLAPQVSSPVSGWLLPLDAVQLLGVAAETAGAAGVSTVLHLPGGGQSAVALPAPRPPPLADRPGAAWEVVELAGTPALRFYSGEALSLLLIDLDLAPLAVPEATAIVDAAVAKAGSDHALLVVVSALEEATWESSLLFEQDGRALEVRHPYRLRVYRGSAEMVGPDAPAAAVVLLPATFSLYRPLTVSWAGLEAAVTFRR